MQRALPEGLSSAGWSPRAGGDYTGATYPCTNSDRRGQNCHPRPKVLGARSVRAAALFCPLVEEPEREAGPAAMGPPPWGSEHGLYVVVVNAGGALMGREPQLQLPVHMRLKVHD